MVLSADITPVEATTRRRRRTAACRACGDIRPTRQLVRARRPFPKIPGAYENVVYCIDRPFCGRAFPSDPDLLEG